jgi:hypothetical protein
MKYRRNATPAMVSETVMLQLVDPAGSTPLEANVRYDARDPYAVSATFLSGGRAVAWTFARDLLSRGLHEPTGDGDVRVRPSLDGDRRAILVIELCSPDGEAVFHARTSELSGFLQRTHDLVPPDTEHQLVDLDRTIISILAAAS